MMTTSPRSPRPIAWVDGRILPATEATVPLLDDGFLRGDAVFDAMLVRRGRTHAAEEHLARLRRSGKAMGIRIPAMGRVITDLLAAWGEHDGALKLIVTRGGAVRGLLSAPTWPEVIALHPVDIPWRSALTGIKTLSYAANQWALRVARDHHADDALIVTDGVVQELPTGTIVAVVAEQLRTPDPAVQPILDSVTVQVLERIHPIERCRLTLDDLRAADELFVVSATRPILAVHALADLELQAPGPVTARLRERLDAHIESTLD